MVDPRSRSRIGLALLAVLAGALSGAAGTASGVTVLASRTPAGGVPHGPSAHPAFSQDRTGASLLAFDSSASDLVGGDSNGLGDVFVVRRAKPFDAAARRAKAWRPGATSLVSVG